MAVAHARVTVGDTAARLDTTVEDDYSTGPGTHQVYRYGHSITVHNRGAVSVFLGGAGVTAAAGFELAAGADLTLNLKEGDELYGVCAATQSAACHVLQVGV